MNDNQGHHGCASIDEHHFVCNGIQTYDIDWDTKCWYLFDLGVQQTTVKNMNHELRMMLA